MSPSAKRRKARMARFHRRTQPGAPPGILVPLPDAPRSRITFMAYGPDGYVERPVERIADLPADAARWPVAWINVDGLGDAAAVAEIGRLFNLHRLALEDVLHVHQRAKAEDYEGTLFVVARAPHHAAAWQTEQIGMFVGPNFVISFQEHEGGDCLDPLRVRIRTGVGRLRGAGPDLLLHAILDTIIDHYFPWLEECGERLDALEEEAVTRPHPNVMAGLHDVKQDLLLIRRAVWPLRDALNTLLRDPMPRVGSETRLYLRDCHDHTIQIIDLVESYRDVASGLTDVYLSTVGNRTNEIMRVLTVISTIFIPLTFLVGLYGMNFKHMPELAWRWGYPLVLVAMAGIAAGMLRFFWRKGWLGAGRSPVHPPAPPSDDHG